MSSDVWTELKQRFRDLLDYTRSAATELHYDMLQPSCEKAGMALFEVLTKDSIASFDVDETFLVIPVAEKEYFDQQRQESVDAKHYDNYWLCLLGSWGRNDKIFVGHQKLRKTRIPLSGSKVCWAAWHHIYEVADSFFTHDNAYICEVCRASTQACDRIRTILDRKHTTYKKDWKPSAGYIGSKTIVGEHGVSRTTLQHWEQRDPPTIERDPSSQEKYFPRAWLEEQMKTWKPRRKTP